MHCLRSLDRYRLALKPLAAFVLFLLLQGCATRVDLDKVKAAYDGVKPCCKDFSQMTFEPLAFGADTRLSIEETDPAFDFGADGLSYFKAFALPARDNNYVLDLRSYILATMTFPANWVAFFPVVTMLDEQKHVLMSTKASQIQLVHESEERAMGLLLDLRNQPRARYIVIHTSNDLIQTAHDLIYPDYDIGVATIAGTTMTFPKAIEYQAWGSPVCPRKNLRLHTTTVVPTDALRIDAKPH